MADESSAYRASEVERLAHEHPDHCSCAVPCRTCGHESEQHMGSMWYGTGPRRCGVNRCRCLGCYIGATPARCKHRSTPASAYPGASSG